MSRNGYGILWEGKHTAKNAKTKKKVVDLGGFIGYTILA